MVGKHTKDPQIIFEMVPECFHIFWKLFDVCLQKHKKNNKINIAGKSVYHVYQTCL